MEHRWPAAYASLGLLLAIAGAVFVSSCSTKPRKDFNLTLIVSKKLGDSKTSELPKDIIDLCLPIESCEKFTLVPQPVLYRLGSDKSAEISLSVKIEGGFAGNKDNPRLIRKKIEKHLSSIKIGEIFSQSLPVDSNTLNEYLESIGKKSLIIFNTEEEISASYSDIRFCNSIESARALIAQEVCNESISSVSLFIEPPMISSSVNSVNYNPLEREEILKGLSNENLRASMISDRNEQGKELRAVYTRTKLESERDPSDYRFTYELVKNRIYGKEHHEAFELLRKAAGIAIDNNQARYMLDRINEDKETFPVQKLAHGHSHEWDPIVEALRRNDKNRLHAHHGAEE